MKRYPKLSSLFDKELGVSSLRVGPWWRV